MKQGNSGNNSESEVWNAISAFEAILEAMPNDRVALETLYKAYDQIGEASRAIEYLVRFSEAVVEEGDTESAPELLQRISEITDEDEHVQSVKKRLEDLIKGNDGASLEEELSDSASAMAMRKTIDITNELSLAWNLQQAGQLSEDQYSSVVHDLSENSTKNIESPVSVLHVLSDRGLLNLDDVVGFLAKDSSTPIIKLSNFELQHEAYSLLPIEFMTCRGAIIFELMGKDALVAILNPYDKEIRTDLTQVTRKNCHYFLVTAEEYDNYLDAIKKDLLAIAEDN